MREERAAAKGTGKAAEGLALGPWVSDPGSPPAGTPLSPGPNLEGKTDLAAGRLRNDL